MIFLRFIVWNSLCIALNKIKEILQQHVLPLVKYYYSFLPRANENNFGHQILTLDLWNCLTNFCMIQVCMLCEDSSSVFRPASDGRESDQHPVTRLP